MPIKKRLFYPTVAAVLLAASSAALAIKLSPPPPRKYVSQTWVAFSTEDHYSMRFTLKPDGSGAGVLLRDALHAPESEAFKITSWSYSDYALALTVHFENIDIGITSINGEFKRQVTSHVSGMLPDPDRLSESWLPGPLELSLRQGEGQLRFGAWPEHDVEAILNALKSSRTQ